MVSFIVIAAYALAIVLLYLAYNIFIQYTYWKFRKVLHAETIPIVGVNAPVLFRMRSTPKQIQKLYNKHPEARYYGFFEFFTPGVMITDPELIREVCVKKSENFMDHLSFVTEEMDPVLGRNLFSITGQRWKDVRSTISPSYTAARMKIIFKLIDECSNDFVEYLIENPEVTKNFEMKEIFTRYTTDIIATSSFGIKVNSLRDQENEFFANGQDALNAKPKSRVAKFLLLVFIPQFMRLFGTTFLPKKVDTFFKKLIFETVSARKEKGIVRPDMLQLLIQAMDKEGVNITMDDIVAQAFIFFLAGLDTSSTLEAFICLELAVNQDIQERLRQEIDEKLKYDSQVSYESLTELKYLDMVISEALRMYPPASGTNRLCMKETEFPAPMEGYSGFIMQEKTILSIPIYGLHHDPKYFPEPEKFLPERFSDDNKDKIKPYTYLPFGVGPRKCIAYRFALMISKIIILNIVKRFVIKFSEKTEYPVELKKTGAILSTENGIWLKFEERKKAN